MQNNIEIGGKNGVPLPPPRPSVNESPENDEDINHIDLLPPIPENDSKPREIPPPPPKNKNLATRVIPKPPSLSLTKQSVDQQPTTYGTKRGFEEIAPEDPQKQKQRFIKNDEVKALIDTSKIFGNPGK